MQETAIDWLISRFYDVRLLTPWQKEIIKYAKEREKAQMIDFYNWMRRNDSAEEYFHYSDEDMLNAFLNQNK